MPLHPHTDSSMNLFTGHGEGYVSVNTHHYRQPIVITAQEIHTDWPATDFAGLTTAHFEYFLGLKPEVLLFGTGAKQQFAQPALYRALIEARIGIEFMDTPAACRTYNILVAENRKVVAAILI